MVGWHYLIHAHVEEECAVSVLYWLESIRTPFLDTFFSIITHLGSETALLVIAIIVFWCISKKDGYYLLSVGFLGTMINQFLKLLCCVPRPWVKDPNFTIVESAREGAGGYSFPSGHTQSVMATLGCPARFTKSTFLRIVCIVLILLTAISRMYLGVHTPLDVGVSLVIGALLVWKLYPPFAKSDEDIRPMLQVMVSLALLSAAFVVYMQLHKWPDDIDPHNLESGIKNSWQILGCCWGMLVAFVVEKRSVNFDTHAPWWAQILKTAIGLTVVLALKSGLKPILNALFGGHIAATAPRYFLIVVFAACVWPLTFRWFAAGCPLKKKC